MSACPVCGCDAAKLSEEIKEQRADIRALAGWIRKPGPCPPNDSPDYVCALEIHIHLLRAELADERAKKSDTLIAAADDIERLTAERDAAAALARNYAERMARSDAELAEARALLGLLADIRAAVGDPTGRLMQNELVERCRQLRADRDMWQADAKQRLAERAKKSADGSPS